MIVNDSRFERKGFKVGDVVRFRYAGMRYRGRIQRLTSSAACIRFYNTPHIDVRRIAYRQIDPPEKDS